MSSLPRRERRRDSDGDGGGERDGKNREKGRGWGRGDISLMPSVTRARAESGRRSPKAKAPLFRVGRTYFFVLEAAWISVRVVKCARHSKTARCRPGRGRAPWNTPFRCTTSITTTRRWRLGGSTARVERGTAFNCLSDGEVALGARAPWDASSISSRCGRGLTVSFDAPRAPHLVV